MKGGQECQFSGLCPQRAHCRTIVRTLPHITIVDTMPHITILYHPSPSPVTCELPNINRGIPTTLPLPVLSCKLQNSNDVMIPALKYFLLLLATFPLSLWQLRAQMYPALKYALCVDICGTRWRTRPGSFYQMEYVWCTSAVTKAEIRPRAPQLWHKLGAKKYCWRDLAVFQRRFEKKID